MEGFDNNNMPVNSGDPGMQNGSDIQNTAGMPENAGFPDASSAMPQNSIAPDASSAMPQNSAAPDASSAMPQNSAVPDASSAMPQNSAAPDASSAMPQNSVAPDAANMQQNFGMPGVSGGQDAAPQGGVFNPTSSDYMSPVFMQTPPADPAPSGKKKKIWPLVVGLAALVLVGGGVILFLMRDVIANSIAKSSKTPEEYLRYVVEKQDWDKSLKGYEEAYKQLGEMDQMKMEGEMRLQMSDDMLDNTEKLIEEAIEKRNSYYTYYWDDDDSGKTDIRLDAWQDIALKFEGQRGEQGASAMQAVQLKDKDYLITLEEKYDADKSTAYIRIPQVNEDYAAINLSNFLKDDELDMVNSLFASNGGGFSAMPTPKALKSMKERYLTAVLDQVDDVDMNDDKLEVNGQSMKCTVLTVEFDEELQKSIAKAVIEEMINDSDLEDLFYNFMKEANVESQGVDPDTIWEQFIKGLEDAETQLDDYTTSFEPDIQIYVNNKGNIVGLSMEEGKDSLMFGYIVKGTKAWFEVSAVSGKNELFSVKGEGSVGINGANMKGTLFIEEADELEIPFSVENVSDKGGTFRMELEPICDIIRDEADDDDVDDLMDMLEGELVLEIKSSELEGSQSFYIENDGEKQIGISYIFKLSKAGEIEFPANKETVKINSTMELLPYVGDCDLDELVDILEQLGLPESSGDELRDEFKYIKTY